MSIIGILIYLDKTNRYIAAVIGDTLEIRSDIREVKALLNCTFSLAKPPNMATLHLHVQTVDGLLQGLYHLSNLHILILKSPDGQIHYLFYRLGKDLYLSLALGGELSLLCGSLFPDIECVVAVAPVHIVSQTGSFNGGLHFAKGSPFSFQENPLPYVGVSEEKAAEYVKRMKRNFLRTFEPDMLFYYEEILKSEHDSAADIRVEKINGPILLISGGADVMVPSNWVCEEVIKRLDKNGFKYPHTHKNYELLSHYAAMFRPMSSGLFRVERKHKKECNANREASWNYTLKFLKDEWKI